MATLRISPQSPYAKFFLKISSASAKDISKMDLSRELCRHTPAPCSLWTPLNENECSLTCELPIPSFSMLLNPDASIITDDDDIIPA